MQTLGREDGGIYLVCTASGSQYQVDFEEKKITRNNEWSPRVTDGLSRSFEEIALCQVGMKMIWVDNSGQPHTTTGVESIVRL